MTSANIIEYTIKDKEGRYSGSHRQNVLCKICNDGLERFVPSSDFTICAAWRDENEELQKENCTPLNEWLIKNPAEITFKIKVS